MYPVPPRAARDPSRACAFDAFVRVHLQALHAIARGIVRSDDLAWDAVQDTLVCLWHEPSMPEDLRGWLVRTVVHKCLHVERAAKRRQRHEERVRDSRREPCPLCDPALQSESRELLERLERALERLSTELREVFLLRERQGLDYQEIAEALVVPIGTVRSRLHRAREALARELSCVLGEESQTQVELR